MAAAAARLGLSHVVVTSVTRDDLADGGAGEYAATVVAIRQALPEANVEVLVPDFRGRGVDLETVLAARPDVLDHNLETVPRLYGEVRPGASYRRSLELLRAAAQRKGAGAPALVKTGLMLGLGETADEVGAVLADCAAAGVDLVTVGQYLCPAAGCLPVVRYVPPEEFAALPPLGESLGLRVAAGPFVRSSYRAAGPLPAGPETPARPLIAGVPRAVLLDVDFTVLRPGDLFSAAGYRDARARFGLRLDVDRWDEAERRAYEAVRARRAGRGNAHDDGVYETIAYAIVAAMGGDGRARVDRCAAAIVDAWSRCENFTLYDDVRPCLARLHDAGLVVGLVLEHQPRPLDAGVLEVFDLGELVDGTVTSSQVGLFKPAPEIFAAALAGVGAAAGEAVMVGDSYGDDVAGALAAGLAGAVLLDRAGRRPLAPGQVEEAPVIGSLSRAAGAAGPAVSLAGRAVSPWG